MITQGLSGFNILNLCTAEMEKNKGGEIFDNWSVINMSSCCFRVKGQRDSGDIICMSLLALEKMFPIWTISILNAMHILYNVT